VWLCLKGTDNYIFISLIIHIMAIRNSKGQFIKTTGTRKYHSIQVNGKEVQEHRYVYECYFGKIPEGYVVHHKNGIKNDNRPENLVAVSFQEHNNIHSHTPWNLGIKIGQDKYPNFGMRNKHHDHRTILKQKETWRQKYIDSMRDIFTLVCSGFTYKDIAIIVGLTKDTVTWRYCKFTNCYIGGGVYD
jgi:hypothetical protein